MFNNPVLDVVIGLVFIYLLYSLLATIFQEFIATKLAFRSKVLEKAIIRMLEDGKSITNSRLNDRLHGFWHMLSRPNLLKGRKIATWFYAHPLIKYLGEDNFYSKPAYLSAANFSKVIIDLLRGFKDDTNNELQKINDSIQEGIIYHLPINVNTDKKNPAIYAVRLQLQNDPKEDSKLNLTINPADVTKINDDTRLFLQTLWKESEANLDKFKQKLEQWFDDTMERATGWYKRYTKNTLFIIGLIIAIIFNVNTIGIVKKLRHDPKLREQLVQSAAAYIEKNKQLNIQPESPVALKEISTTLKRKSDLLMAQADSLYTQDISSINKVMGLGWKNTGKPWFILCKHQLYWYTPFEDNGILSTLIGWFLTALALSLGANFWFDLLNKLMKLRGTGDKIDNNDSKSLAAAAQIPASAVVNVNTQPSEEAVG